MNKFIKGDSVKIIKYNEFGFIQMSLDQKIYSILVNYGNFYFPTNSREYMLTTSRNLLIEKRFL